MGKIMTESFQTQLEKRYKKSTIGTIWKMVNYMSKKVGHDLEWEDLEKDQSDNMSDLSFSSRDSRLGYMILLFKLKGKPVPKWMKDYKLTNMTELRKERVENARERREFIDPSDIYEHFKNCRDNYNIRQSRVIFSILKQIPIRLNEMRELTYQDNKDGKNYVDLNKKKLIIREHKTSDRGGGERVYNLNKDALEELKELKDKYNMPYVFFYGKGKCEKRKFAEKEFQDWFKAKITKYGRDKNIDVSGVGIHSMRHGHVSRNMAKLGISQETYEKLQGLADKMGHSIGTALEHYLKGMA